MNIAIRNNILDKDSVEGKNLEAYNNIVSIVGEYKNVNVKVGVTCHLGHYWEVKPNHIKSGHWCPHCSKRSPIQAEINLRSLVESKGGTILGNYITKTTKIRIRCNK